MFTCCRINTSTLAQIISVDRHTFLDHADTADDFGRFVCQLEDLVVGLVSHEVQVPLEVLSADGSQTEVELETSVAHVTHIVEVTAETGRECHRVAQQHVGGLLVEVLEVETDAAIQERSLETCIQVRVLLPAHFLVLQRGDDGTNVVTVSIVKVIEALPCIESTEVIVTLLTIAHLNAQVVDPVDVLHEVLARYTPVTTE